MDKLVSAVMYYISQQQPFKVVLNNHRTWMPAKLDNSPTVVFDIDNTDLEESYIDTAGNIVLTVGIDDYVYRQVITAHDILAVLVEGKVVTRELLAGNRLLLQIPGSEEHSYNCFVRHNNYLKKEDNV